MSTAKQSKQAKLCLPCFNTARHSQADTGQKALREVKEKRGRVFSLNGEQKLYGRDKKKQ